ncbi:MAG: hypothetical protein AAFV53_10075 [Myxococcota bacterium]
MSAQQHQNRHRTRLASARAAGDREAAVEALHEIALARMVQGDFSGALGLAEEALREASGAASGIRARARYVLGRIQLNRGQSAAARDHLDVSADVFAALGDHSQAGEATQQLAQALIAEKQMDAADEALRRAARHFADAGQQDRVIGVLRHRALVLSGMGRSKQSLAVLSEAVRLAGRLEDDAARMQLNLDMLAFSGHNAQPPAGTSHDELFIEAMQKGEWAIAGHAALGRAGNLAQRGDLKGAITDAIAARRLALRSVDVVGYLGACLMLAVLYERDAEPVEVVTVLLTCQETMGRRFGPEARLPALLYLDSLAMRWGTERFEAVIRTYRSQFPEE